MNNLTFDSREIDSTDERLLDVLLADSRLSYRRIASKVGVSVATVMNRVNRLEKEGVIRGYTAVLDYEKLGYEIAAVISMKTSKGKCIQVGNRVAGNPSVAAVFDTTGDVDLIVFARFKTMRALDTFLKRVQTYEFVERTNTVLVLNTIKNAQVSP